MYCNIDKCKKTNEVYVLQRKNNILSCLMFKKVGERKAQNTQNVTTNLREILEFLDQLKICVSFALSINKLLILFNSK